MDDQLNAGGRPESGGRVAALDGLRGLAILGVLLFHGGHLRGGFLGVDLFFVLSGFLITTLLLAEHRASSTIALGSFWAHRARRLLPALGLMLFVVTAAVAIWGSGELAARFRGDVLATIGYVANWHAIFRQLSYFDLLVSAPSPLDHVWSLSIEEQFYLLWPLVFLGVAAVAKARTARAVLVVALALGSVSTVAMAELWSPTNTNRVYYGTDTRAFALFCGIALAAMVAWRGYPRGRIQRGGVQCIGWLGLVVLAIMWATADGQSGRMYRGGFFVAGLAATFVLAAAASPQRGWLAKGMSIAPLRWLGLISYGLYLWHWPVDVWITTESVGIAGWGLFVVRTSLALLLAVFSYVFLEQPIRRGAGSSRFWRVAAPAFVVAEVALLIVAVPGASGGPSDAAVPEALRGRQVLVVGDSMASSLYPGFAANGISAAALWKPGCRINEGQLTFSERYGRECRWRRDWLRKIRKFDPEHVVVFIGVWDLFDIRLRGGNGLVKPGDPAWEASFQRGLRELVSFGAEGGRTVTLVNLPCFTGIANAPITREFLRGAWDIARVQAANRIISEVAATDPQRVRLADAYSVLCPGGRYLREIDGAPSRTDGMHLSAPAAKSLVRWLAPQLPLRARGDRPDPSGAP